MAKSSTRRANQSNQNQTIILQSVEANTTIQYQSAPVSSALGHAAAERPQVGSQNLSVVVLSR
jgi:hypothetical protein